MPDPTMIDVVAQMVIRMATWVVGGAAVLWATAMIVPVLWHALLGDDR